MKRTNTFAVRTRSEHDEQLLRELLDASASLWNELTYERRQQYFDGESVWDTEDYRKKYVGVLGSATAQQVIRKNKSAWKSFFAAKENGEEASPPGYWGNEDDGRVLRTYIRNDQYTLEMGDRSRLEIPVGQDLKEKYGLGHYERLRLEVAGDPKWDGKQGRLELYYDERSDQFRAFQPVTVDDFKRIKDSRHRRKSKIFETRLDSPVAEESAALDIGANNIVACTTTTGEQYLYEGRDLFERFHETTRRIAELQSKLDSQRRTSKQIDRLYRRRTRRRDHAQEALARDLSERLYDEGVSTVYVGDLTDVLETHWSVQTNEKLHNFWAFQKFVDRLACTAEEYGITVEARSEAWTSQTCPNCGSIEDTTRHQDTLTCTCGFGGHVDLVASETFLRRHESVARPMARPVCLKWDDHSWSEMSHSHRPNEEHTNRSIHA